MQAHIAGLMPVTQQEMKDSRYFIPKIIAGYLLIAAMCAIAVVCVYDKIDISSDADREYAMLERRSEMIDRTLMNLYRAESHAQMILAGDERYTKAYDADIEATLQCIDSLRGMASVEADTMRMAQLDTVSMLIGKKRTELLRLSAGMKQAEAATSVIERNIARIAAIDTLVRDTLSVTHTVVKTDTAVVHVRKRRFFRRVADLFRPPKTDTAMIVSTDIHTDSIPLRLSDTINGVLVDLKYQVIEERERSLKHVARLRRDVASANTDIDQRILTIIGEMKSDWDSHALRRNMERDASRRDAISTLGIVAISAVVLVFLFMAVIFRDWRRSQRIRRELERTNNEKQRLLDYREHLMLAVTHDIKSPAGSIIGYLDLLERLDVGERQRLYIEGMKQSAEHLQSLIESLLEFYRLDSDRAETMQRPFNAAQLFATAARNMAASRYAKSDVSIEAQIDPSADRIVVSDPMRIRQIVDNLISNALKFTQQGSVTVGCRIDGDNLQFTVADTGCGMSLEDTRRIFGSFVRLQSASGIEGFGLGLSIVDRAVRLLKGSIDVKSRRGEGSRFTVTIPVGKSQSPAPDSTLVGRRILAVDDDKLQLDMLTAIAPTLEIDLECCRYPAYAAQVVGQSRFDAVMTDIQMPECNGFEVLRQIRERSASLPVVAVTARGQSSERELLTRGFAAVLRKPYTAADIRRVLTAVLGHLPANQPADSSSPAPTADTAESIDFSALTAFADDDSEARCRIVSSFIEQMRADADTLRNAAAGDIDKVKATAHKVRPMAEMVGAATLARQLRTVECDTRQQTDKQRLCDMADSMEALAHAAQTYLDDTAGRRAEQE